MDRPMCETCVHNKNGRCTAGPPIDDYKWPKVADDDSCGKHPLFDNEYVERWKNAQKAYAEQQARFESGEQKRPCGACGATDILFFKEGHTRVMEYVLRCPVCRQLVSVTVDESSLCSDIINKSLELNKRWNQQHVDNYE